MPLGLKPVHRENVLATTSKTAFLAPLAEGALAGEALTAGTALTESEAVTGSLGTNLLSYGGDTAELASTPSFGYTSSLGSIENSPWVEEYGLSRFSNAPEYGNLSSYRTSPQKQGSWRDSLPSFDQIKNSLPKSSEARGWFSDITDLITPSAQQRNNNWFRSENLEWEKKKYFLDRDERLLLEGFTRKGTGQNGDYSSTDLS